MPSYNKQLLAEKAKELSVVRDTLEKVMRLRDILAFFDTSELLSESMALKGGTAINLIFFDLPRLSVDIDLDFCVNISRKGMMEKRERIGELIEKYMTAEGYVKSPKSKIPHSLDSFVYSYTNAAGITDNIKIEINYSLRSHVLPTEKREIKSEVFDGSFKVNTVSPIEIYASKTVALLTRAAARDLYDLNYMIRYGLFSDNELELYRKCVIFYLAVATQTPPLELDYSSIDGITAHKIKTDLKPVIRVKDEFELDEAKKTVTEFLKQNLYITEKEQQFLKKFKKGYYKPELLFDDEDTLNRIKNHPMAIWKTENNRDNLSR